MALMDVKDGFWGIRRQIESMIGKHLTNSILQQAGANGGASFAKSFLENSGLDGAKGFAACVNAYQLAGFGEFEITELTWPVGRIEIRANQAFEAWMYQHKNQQVTESVCAYTSGVFVGFVNVIGNRQDIVCIEQSCQANDSEACLFELIPLAQSNEKHAVPFRPDPGLGRHLNLLKILFERMPMGIAVLDRDLNIQRYNPTWMDFSNRYKPPSGAKLVPGVNYFDHIPGAETVILPLFQRTLSGETIRQEEVRIDAGGVTSFWNIVFSPLVENDKVVGILAVSVDATERVKAQHNLEQRVNESTRELRTVLQMSHDINATLQLDTLLDIILDKLKSVVDYTGASIMTLEENELVMRVYRGPIPSEKAQNIRFPIETAMVNHEVIRKKKPLVIADTREDTVLSQMFMGAAGNEINTTYRYIRSWLGVPLIVKDVIMGMLTLDHSEPNFFTENHAELVFAFANQAATAIENARLYQETERRAEESEALFTVQQAITSKLEMSEVLQLIADEGRRLTNSDISAVYLLDRDELEIAYVSGDVPESILGYRLALNKSIAGRVIANQKVIRVPDTYKDDRVDREASDRVGARSLMIVPLISGREPVGTITVANHTPGGFSQEDELLLTKLAGNVVISLENARLYREEQERRQVAEALRETLAVLNSKQPLNMILDHIASQAVRLMGATSAVVYQVQPEPKELLIMGGSQVPDALYSLGAIPLYEGGAVEKMFNKTPYIIRNIQSHIAKLDADKFKTQDILFQWLQVIKQNFGAYLGMPLVISDEIYGSLSLYFKDTEDFSDEAIELGLALANQAVLAIENARLLERAEEVAITAERNRLARDLHDAVTQTLFSASLIADVLPRIWERNIEEGHSRLEELRQLTKGALSEMRTLLLELRPAAMIDTNLEELIGHQVNAFVARTRLQAEYRKNVSGSLSPEVKEVFYRVTQEVFNNISKHAQASAVSLELEITPVNANLTIADNGIGFEQENISSDHLGLRIMQERAESIDAQLNVKSKFNHGTTIKLIWPKPGSEKNE